jgi:hypothetical protein
MRLKIISDGTIAGTKVYDCMTGEMLNKVTNIEIEIGVETVPKATITFLEPEIEIIADEDIDSDVIAWLDDLKSDYGPNS